MLPLERAQARLDLAADEADDAKRDALIAKAKTEFEQFLTVHKSHPRQAEAAVALARVVSAQAKSALSRSNKLADDAKRQAERAKARPIFEDAAKRFGQAAAGYAKKLDDPDLTPAQKKETARAVFQAELDRAVNSYLLADTYDSSDAKGKVARGNALKQARDLFVQLGQKDETNPMCWVARAWAAECLREMDSAVAARKEFDAVQDAAKKFPAAAAGRGWRGSSRPAPSSSPPRARPGFARPRPPWNSGSPNPPTGPPARPRRCSPPGGTSPSPATSRPAP